MVKVKIVSAGKHFMKSELVVGADLISPNDVQPLAQGEVSGTRVSKAVVLSCIYNLRSDHCKIASLYV